MRAQRLTNPRRPVHSPRRPKTCRSPTAAFDAAMAVLSEHHRTIRSRVWARWPASLSASSSSSGDETLISRFRLVRDHLPELASTSTGRPSLSDRAAAMGAQLDAVSIPWDCADGFFHAYWRRPRPTCTIASDAARRSGLVWLPTSSAERSQTLRTTLTRAHGTRPSQPCSRSPRPKSARAAPDRGAERVERARVGLPTVRSGRVGRLSVVVRVHWRRDLPLLPQLNSKRSRAMRWC